MSLLIKAARLAKDLGAEYRKHLAVVEAAATEFRKNVNDYANWAIDRHNTLNPLNEAHAVKFGEKIAWTFDPKASRDEPSSSHSPVTVHQRIHVHNLPKYPEEMKAQNWRENGVLKSEYDLKLHESVKGQESIGAFLSKIQKHYIKLEPYDPNNDEKTGLGSFSVFVDSYNKNCVGNGEFVGICKAINNLLELSKKSRDDRVAAEPGYDAGQAKKMESAAALFIVQMTIYVSWAVNTYNRINNGTVKFKKLGDRIVSNEKGLRGVHFSE